MSLHYRVKLKVAFHKWQLNAVNLLPLAYIQSYRIAIKNKVNKVLILL